MEILKRGDTGENWTKDITCNSCKSELRVNISDLKHNYYGGDQREPNSGYDRMITTCPVCSSRLIVCHTRELPIPMQRKIKEQA